MADLFLVADVSLDELDLRAEAAEFGGECLPGIFPATGNDDPVAGFRKSDGGGAADARKRAGDQYDG